MITEYDKAVIPELIKAGLTVAEILPQLSPEATEQEAIDFIATLNPVKPERFNETQLKVILALYRNPKVSIEQILESFNLYPRDLYKILRDNNVEKRTTHYQNGDEIDKDIEDHVVTLYKAGASYSEITADTRKSAATIGRILKRNNIKLRKDTY